MQDGYHVGPPDSPGRYRLVELLGSGGEGSVWKAELRFGTPDQPPVAIKIEQPVVTSAGRDAWERFRSLLLRLPRIGGLVTVHEAFTGTEPTPGPATDPPDGVPRPPAPRPPAPGFRYVVMAYLPGPSLSRGPHPASIDDRLRALRPVAEALDALHRGLPTAGGGYAPVVHGDVKPENVVLDENGQGVLVDLGSAFVTGDQRRTGITRMYAAPELRQPGGRPTPESDRYAFAATAAFAVLGAPPGKDHGIDPRDLDRRLGAIPDLAQRPKLRHALTDALMVSPPRRPAPLTEWLDALAPPRRRLSRVLLGAAAALVLALIGTIGLVLLLPAGPGADTPDDDTIVLPTRSDLGTPSLSPSPSDSITPSQSPSASGLRPPTVDTGDPAEDPKSSPPPASPLTATIGCTSSCTTTDRTVLVDGDLTGRLSAGHQLQLFTEINATYYAGSAGQPGDGDWTGQVIVGNDKGAEDTYRYRTCVYDIDETYVNEMRSLGQTKLNEGISRPPQKRARELDCTTITWNRPS